MHTELNQLTLLADWGYLHHRVITPASVDWSNCSSSHQVIVENVFAQVKKFAATSATLKQSPEIQALSIVVCFALVAQKTRAIQWFFPREKKSLKKFRICTHTKTHYPSFFLLSITRHHGVQSAGINSEIWMCNCYYQFTLIPTTIIVDYST